MSNTELARRAGAKAKEIVKEAEQAAYSVTGLSSEIRGTEILQKVQKRINEVVERELRWNRSKWEGANLNLYFVTAVVEQNSIRIKPSPALYELIFEYDQIMSFEFAALNDNAIKERNADPFYQWLDSLKETQDEDRNRLIRRMRNNFHEEVAIAKFIFESLPKG